MATVKTVTLTGDLSSLLVGVDLERRLVRARLESNAVIDGKPVPIIDTNDSGAIHFGTAEIKPAADGTFSLPGIIASDATGINIIDGSLRYRVVVEVDDRATGRALPAWDSGWLNLTASADLKDIAGSSVAIPPVWSDAFRAEMEGLRDDAEQAVIDAADASRLEVGTTATGAPGSSVAVTITGAAGEQKLNLTIPRGDKGDQGEQGIQGPKGDKGDQGEQGVPGPGSAAWTPATAVTTGAIRQAPDGSYIRSNAARTTGITFDATEAGNWTAVVADPTTVAGAALSASTADSIEPGETDPQAAVDARVGAALAGSFASHDTALRKWYAALGNRYTIPAKVIVMGDSNSEGTGAVSWRKRWQALLQQALLQRFPVAGVAGADIAYITANPRVAPALADSPVTTAGGPGGASYGLGLRALNVQDGQSVTFTFTGDRCILLGGNSALTGIYNIVLDGGAAVTVDGYNPTAQVFSQIIWDSGAIAPGVHTVTVTRDAGSWGTRLGVFPEGLLAYNGDYAAGVRVIDAARHGAQVNTFSDSTAWHTAIASSGPYHLAVMPFGANDANVGNTAATFKSRLLDLIADLRGAGFAGSILLVGMPKRSEVTDVLWAQYLIVMREVADLDADVTFLDLRARIPDAGTAEAIALDLYADTVHYKPGAQGWIADEITNAIIPR